ncbi:peptidyl-tRNA hydrolase [Prauserella marina]|uniref:peptidyl-tRNA hydrolase n=1 Tax=Prauserella marina TaxID=530584 RepID=A0A222VV11_9PSEU|nr:peptidyl-tRNA hydrolase [Prauserella marina]ASR37769.1 peptidyl-tRNA hydrolase [Prauserella marina]PWV75720.1 peptidyl-tRNA hydrolase [Prauserella marina]SDD27908.1 Peptidyl-tRNA hydrolase [Prauserella marina]
MSGVLAPLAARYASWLGLPAERTAEPEAAPDQVRAMPVVLRMERAEPPTRTALLEAAATAALAVCLDERAEQGGEWHEPVHAWLEGHIRKVARRARGAHWHAVQNLPGITVTVGGAQVRALLPDRVAELPKEVTRLQISGSDLPDDEPGAVPAGMPLLLLNPEVTMTVGKAAAQVGHGSMLLAALLAERELARWKDDGYRCAVRTAKSEEWAALQPRDPAATWQERKVLAVRDAGYTEIAPGTVTVLAQWRDES